MKNTRDRDLDLFPVHEPSYWLRTHLGSIAARLNSGELQPCEHLQSVEVGFISLWTCDRVRCLACLAADEPGGDERWRCDRCGQVRHRDVRTAVVRLVPNVVVGFGLCGECYAREVGQ